MTKGQNIRLSLLTLVLGALTVGIGYVVGNSSSSVVYGRVDSVHVTVYISGTEDNYHVSYLKIDDGRLFYIHEHDFSPNFSATDLNQTSLISFVYREDSSTSIDESSTGGTHLSGDAYRIIAISTPDAGQQLYTTELFVQHPDGFFNSRWDVAYILYGIGALIALGGLVFRGRGPLVTAMIAGGAAVLPIGWLLLLDSVSGADWESGSNAAGQQIFVAKILCASGAAIGAVVGVFTVFKSRSD